GAPMIPRPTKPTRSTAVLVVFVRYVVAREKDASIASVFAHEERSFLGLVDVHRRNEQLVGHMDEAVRTPKLVRDRLGDRVLLERVHQEGPRLLHQREELERIELSLVRDEHRGAELLIALVDLVEEHRSDERIPLDSKHLH